MANPATDLLEIILRECAAAAPQPWYPAAYAQATGVPRDPLDASLDQLRLGGLIQLTEWVQGRGQGYVLTPCGTEVLQSPRLLNRLRADGVPALPVETVPVPRPGADRPTAWDRGEAVRQALFAPATPRVTLTLLFLNILVFVYGCVLAVQAQVPLNSFIAGGTAQVLEILHRTGAITRADVALHGQWWRLLSCCFVHIGLLHLAVNMYSLYVVGPLLERMWGTWCFVLLYLITGLAGSCAMVVFSVPNFLGAGASGALWGVMASMATWVFLNRRHLPGQVVRAWQRQLLLVFLLNVFITFSIPSISASAHFGGGVAGLVVAVPLQYLRRGPGWQRWLALLGVAAVPLLSLGLVEHSVGPEREQLQAGATYLPRVVRTRGQDLKVFREYVKPLILKPVAERRKDPVNTDARKAVAKVREDIQQTADFLASAGRFRDPTAAEAMKAARDYLEAARQFYSAFQRSLDPQANWSDQDDATLGRQYQDLLTARSNLNEIFEERRRGA